MSATNGQSRCPQPLLGQNPQQRVSSLCQIGDVRDADKLNRMFSGVDIVLHTAALKHVILCERAPFDAVQTNIMGVKNVIEAALNNDVERVIFTSSDKAVNPTNVMGTSKLMGERLITLREAELERLGLTEPLLTAVREARRIRSHGGLSRQKQYIGKLMREIDLAPLEAALGPAAAPPRPRRAKPGRFR